MLEWLSLQGSRIARILRVLLLSVSREGWLCTDCKCVKFYALDTFGHVYIVEHGHNANAELLMVLHVVGSLILFRLLTSASCKL